MGLGPRVFCARIAAIPRAVGRPSYRPVNLTELRKICQKLSNPFISTISGMIGNLETSGKSCSGATIQVVGREEGAGCGMTPSLVLDQG